MVNLVDNFPLFDSVDYNFKTIISLLIFVGLQLLFVFNFFISILKKTQHLSHSVTQQLYYICKKLSNSASQ